MGKLSLYGIAGGLFLSSAGALWWQTSSLEDAQTEIGRMESEISQCADVNEEETRKVKSLTLALNKLVEEREIDQFHAQRALDRLKVEEKALEVELASARSRLEELYHGNCEAWASIPVCGPVERELRDQ